MSRSFVVAMLFAMLAGCASIDEGSERAGQALSRVGNTIEDGADAAGRKTRTLWQRWFGGGSSSSQPKRRQSSSSSAGTASSGEPAQFDTYAQEKVGD